MAKVTRAAISVWEGGCLWIGQTHAPYSGDVHVHHALQLSFCFTGTMTLRADGKEACAPVILVDADVPHNIEIQGEAALLFLDPEGPAGRTVRADSGAMDGLAALDDPRYEAARHDLAAIWATRLTGEPLRLAARNVAERLAGKASPRLPDPRVRQLIDAVDGRGAVIDFATAARDIALSPSRLRHLFAEEVGLPFKSYVLWRRLMRAVDAIGQGESLTDAAHDAGFADSAHFSRTFRRSFGLSANMIERL